MNTLLPLLIPTQICPVAPAGVSTYTDQISGNVVWVVIWLFVIAFFVSVGAILLGRITHSPHLSKGGVIGLLSVLALAVVLMGGYGMLTGILGSGCVG